ncbi:Gfo/Idh/MocA family protein [Vallitalea maricola]|uniref:Gfo/Idh/MocA family oxidoreductase n=1 Tax=Vallitalea maricola TaxID=3074433 RepID=A0ACB5UEI1_9FIRM|nr:Gfo/Idh/MocA family oxidoreductase [Vallitalea sp. AN17-2]
MQPITAILIGAGQRGKDVLAAYALDHPEDLKFVAVAEPNDRKRKQFIEAHNIPEDMAFKTWEDLLEKPKLADAAFICTLDDTHYDPTKLALEKDYHILLEKPLSNNPKECVLLGELAKQYSHKVFSVYHVLRYTNFFSKIKELIDEKVIGDIMTINHNEYVGRIHQSHSFVRGNWGNSKTQSPMILQKCCHDMDILLWLVGNHCKKISSFGSLDYYKEKNAPKGAPERCLDGCPIGDTCPYNAEKIYLGDKTDWPVSAISPDTSYEARKKALEEGPYGRCVYKCDNDVVDHQVVNMVFDNNVTAHLTMTAFCKDGGRHIKIMGTKGEITGDFDYNEIRIKRFPSEEVEVIDVAAQAGGHGGGDTGLMEDYIQLIKSSGKLKGKTEASISVQSHVMAFAAEESRLTDKVIHIHEFTQQLLEL